MGIDPGLQITGYGIVDIYSNEIKLVEAGCIRTNIKDKLENRLKTIYDGVSEILHEFQPEVISIENLYSHYSHPRTAIIMAHARGVLYLTARLNSISVVEYSATRIKKSLTGHGRATKQQIQKSVQNTLKLPIFPQPSDVTDALASALCHTNTVNHHSMVKL